MNKQIGLKTLEKALKYIKISEELKEMNKMTEYNLKFKDFEDGKVYEINNGSRYRVIQGLLWSFHTGDWTHFSHNETSQFRFKEVVNVSDDEKRFLSLINDTFEWIARDKNGSVYIYTDKPFIDGINWDCVRELGLAERLSLEYFCFNLDFISWEDEKPTRISDLLRD
jgi:hypothetical protein